MTLNLKRASFMKDMTKGNCPMTMFSDVMDQNRTMHVAERVKGMSTVLNNPVLFYGFMMHLKSYS